jgi:hypothetical protein
MISIEMSPTITAYISSKDRYFTTLPMAISSIITQSLKPNKIVIYEDGEHVDLRENSIYKNLFSLMGLYGIEWEVIYAMKRGQVWNHDHMTRHAKTDLIWRIDDDNIADPNVLETLVQHFKNEKIGAAASLVIDPKQVAMLPDFASNDMKNIMTGVNIQWFKHPTYDIKYVDHIYSSFLYRKEAGKHGYNLNLSPVGHREETIFTYEMKLAGWQLIVDPSVVTWHIREPTGGIRSYQHQGFWDADEKIFQELLDKWHITSNCPYKLIVLDNGLGDHWMFKNILPEIIEQNKNKEIIIAACYPQVFEDVQGVKIISIADAKTLDSNLDKYNVYKVAGDINSKTSLIDVFRKIYL